ncbi:MAG: SDR family oxidoreductase [Clostridia bacterium]|nr:SDR family oxidoreductase [Clostridia bacterium]
MIDMSLWQALAKERIHDRPDAPGRLKGKIAVVTGGAQGLGLGIAQILYREGASVMLADLNEKGALAAAQELGDRADAMRADVTKEEDVAALVQQTVERFGGIDLFVSNAGIVRSGPLDKLEKEDFDLVTSVNYTAFFLCAKYASIIMTAQHEADPAWTGDIVTINSKSGLIGSSRNFAYAGSKFGAVGLVQSFAMELYPRRIKVNAVCPGEYLEGPLWSDPEKGLFRQYFLAGKVPGAKSVEEVKYFYEHRTPMGRGCLPEDVACALLYVVEQQYETGQAIPVTGGQIMLA